VLLGGAAVLLPEQTHLVAEIVSPGNHRRDYHDKPRIYAEAAIPTFLRVELSGTGAPHVEVLHLRDGVYTPAAKVDAGQVLELAEPFPVTFDPGCLLGRRPR
jgi:Uma2 family endonuclease